MLAPQTATATAHWQNQLLWYSFPALDQYSDRLVHGFSTRLGGVSEGFYSSLNLGLGRGDKEAHVYENYRLFAAAVGFDQDKAIISAQTHGTTVLTVSAADAGQGLVKSRAYHDIDGLATADKNLPLVTTYADCTPLLFYAPDRHMIANCHAGWRGTAKKMAASGVKLMIELGCDPSQLIVIIGPSAGPERYEVSADTAACFAGLADERGAVIAPIADKDGKFMLDMWRANRTVLMQSGVLAENIHIADLCTIEHADIFYSHRIVGNERGSLAAVIMLK